ncbi:putative transcriptional regulator [Alkaliphilus metalliredigens QYMF]|uniref:Segregation and condensation protein B n=1 Tax=Alkaliphilus metalliredigens (strain QYMF) TaxID=293826 RepID=SCPB_ALKMQ|nr:SMC-Scp complex subunit ScpB [Alkaliphilus metalliredigens]A6TR67.1 RecName: Full=Segregation and condensation protein B [Alkaliphilus metalliredigens QYMF]ABR48685.1 putative transcriptional regulator [Alkaliphilus metalliredigens QYMF]
MDKNYIKAAIEAILFAWSDPISSSELSNILDIKVTETKEIMKEMIDEFNFHKRGIQIIQMNDHYQMSTRAEYHEILQKLFEPKQNKGLTQASLETLAIIAYRQPITKTEIESVRGVKCDKAISTLFEKNLIEDRGRLEKTGRPILFGTTLHFLKNFGLKSLEDLPKITEIDQANEEELIKDIYNQQLKGR